ncbi:MATE family efflux transporter [Natranaerobius trueperi]|uniref:Multidrug export protein MepA n=1 Tax=Natranaerobius trueperi TaxID=759412 RepID=A0A226BVT7_9FIRM|nr:MATE family efflux transporter [Natranaerobius trueperi]OWZ83158.1 MATE family efflux transporter [Natranaerobius trueperi]
MEQQNLRKVFLKYAVPSISAMWFFSIYTMIDGIFVGRGIGSKALAAVNLSMPYINTIFAVALLIAVGSSTLITYYLGKGENSLSNNIFTINFIVLTIIGIVLTIISLVFLEDLAIILGATEKTLPLVMDYLKIIVYFSTFFIVAYSLEVLVKADGFPILSIIVVTLAALINIGLDYLLVIKLDFGIQGAAIATGSSQLISYIVFLCYFIWGKSQLKFVKPDFKLSYIKDIFIIGTPESLNELSAAFTIFVFNFTIGRFIGSHGLAAFGVIMYLNNLVLMTMIGINQGMQPLISYYNGQDNEANIHNILKLALKVGLGFSIFFFLSSQFFTEQLVSLFIDSQEQKPFNLSVYGLKTFSIGFLLCSINIILSGYFTALKQVKQAVMISLLRGYLAVGATLLIFPHLLGDFGIWFSPFVYEGITLLLSTILYLYYKKGTITDSSVIPGKI